MSGDREHPISPLSRRGEEGGKGTCGSTSTAVPEIIWASGLTGSPSMSMVMRRARLDRSIIRERWLRIMVEKSRLTELYSLSRVISSTLEPQEVLNLIIDAAVKITRATTGSLMLIDTDSGVLNIEVARGFPPRVISETKLKIGEGVTGWVAKEGKPLLVPDVTKDGKYVKIDKDVKSELAVPLVLEDEVVGVVNVDSVRTSAFTHEDLELLSTLAGQSAKVIQNAKLYEALKRKVEELSALFEIGTDKSLTMIFFTPDSLANLIRLSKSSFVCASGIE